MVVAIKFAIWFIHKNMCCLHKMHDPPLFILFGIISVLQNSIMLDSIVLAYCSILQNKHLANTESIENSRLKCISKKHGDRDCV